MVGTISLMKNFSILVRLKSIKYEMKMMTFGFLFNRHILMETISGLAGSPKGLHGKNCGLLRQDFYRTGALPVAQSTMSDTERVEV